MRSERDSNASVVSGWKLTVVKNLAILRRNHAHINFKMRKIPIVVAPHQRVERLDAFVARQIENVSRSRVQQLLEMGLILVNGRSPQKSYRIRPGDRIDVTLPVPEKVNTQPENIPLQIVYEDSDVLVINKPAGLVVHPGAGNPGKTLQNALLALDPGLALVPRAGLVHRLDKDTSGLLVVARTVEAHAALVSALAARELGRQYFAICNGVMTGGRTVDEPIGRHRTQRTRMAVRSDGREAVTHFRVVQRFRAHTLVRAELETGRTHQIRVHLAHIGYPIVGDPLYGGRMRIPPGGSSLADDLRQMKRQALHAAYLKLAHPITGEEMSWDAPLPEDMTKLLEALARDQVE